MEQKPIDMDAAINVMKLQRNAGFDQIAVLEGRIAYLEAELAKLRPADPPRMPPYDSLA